jgi:hypothetical protein
MDSTKNLNFLQSRDMIISTGFVYGMAQEIRQDKILTHPLSTIFDASFSGCLYAMASEFVSQLLPPVVRPVLPVLLASSIAYNIYTKNNK